MFLKVFVIVVALPCLMKANELLKMAKLSSRDQNDQKQNVPRSLYLGKDKSFGEASVELAKYYLMEEILKKRSSLKDFSDEVNENSPDKCSRIKKVGEPIIHHHSGSTYGSWMRDPLGILGGQKIWYMNSFHSLRKLLEFKTMEHFKAGIVSKTYNLPYIYDGTGAVVYGHYLYYNRANSYYIVKYNLVSETYTTHCPYSSVTARKYSYSWGGYNTYDLSIDESGLWVLFSYSSYSGKLCAVKLDPLTMNRVAFYCPVSSATMGNIGNAFVACGIVYSIKSYSSSSTAINYAYDTSAGSGKSVSIPFTNKFTYNSMVTYNPREKVLYAWDRGNQITYPLEFE